MNILIKTISLENASIYITKDNRKIKLADIQAEVELYENRNQVEIMGSTTINFKKYYFSIIVCEKNQELTDKINEDYLRTVSQIDIVGDIQRTDGSYKRFTFNNIKHIDTDYDTWTFEINNAEQTKELLII